MDKTFTFSDLIRYAYNDTELAETVLIQKALDTNPEIEEIYMDLVTIFNCIDKLKNKPSLNTIVSILKYSKSKRYIEI